MFELTPLEPVDYLVIGHMTVDQTPQGPRLGGTAAYSALTAKALGLRVGIVTAWGGEIPLGPLQSIPMAGFSVEQSTSFENVYTSHGRVQYLRSLAPALDFYHVPEAWRNPAIVHLGPLAQEVSPDLVRYFSASLLGVTPQGWLRAWDAGGRVHPTEWPEASFVLGRAGATVISVEDVAGDEDRIDEMAAPSQVLAVTEGAAGSRLYWNGDVRRFRAPQVPVVDETGAGDVYAASFFSRLLTPRDPWEAARFATQISAISVTRAGLDGIPTPEEIEACMVEVF